MAKQVQLRRGTTAELSSVTGAEGEVIVDTTKDTLTLHDGYTAGGIPMLREDVGNLATQSVGIDKISIAGASAGQALKVNDAGTALEYGISGGLILLGSGELTGTEISALDLNYFTTTYSHYIIYLDQLVCVNTANAVPFMRLREVTAGERGASQYIWSTSHPYSTSSSSSGHNSHGQWNGSSFGIHGTNGLAGGPNPINGLNAEIHIYDPMDVNRWTNATWHSTAMEQSETQMNVHIGGGHYRAREQHNGIRLQYSGDNMVRGKWAVYGVLR